MYLDRFFNEHLRYTKEKNYCDKINLNFSFPNMAAVELHRGDISERRKGTIFNAEFLKE